MKISKFSSVVFVAVVSVLGLASRGLAVPQLQLDIVGGTYDEDTETIVAPAGEVIELIALFTPNGNPTQAEIETMLEGMFYLSSALIGVGDQAGDFGSFSVDGETVNATGDMLFGVPPVESTGGDQGHDSRDLSQHGIFEAYFYELAFQFDSANTAVSYNSQDMPGGLVPSANGETFFQTFTIDTSNLAAGAQLHFDLYTTDLLGPVLLAQPTNNNDDVDRVLFAPFSHDAETNRVPGPATLWLLASGFLGIGLARRRRAR